MQYFITSTTDVERNDYIGAIDYRKTALLRQQTNSNNANRVGSREIGRGYYTVENRL